MPVRDRVVTWFFLHYVMPRAQVIDKPGFVVFKVSQKTDIYSRQVVMPESLYVAIERHFSDKHGKKGRQALYSAGKRFGYRFASVSRAMSIRDAGRDRFARYVKLLARFVEGTYASNISYSLDLDSSAIRFNLENFVVCRESGLGYIISSGGIGGIWAYMMGDPSIEAVQPICQGRGDKECEVIAGPPGVLKKYGQESFQESGLKGLGVDTKYRKMNEISPVAHARNSLKKMIDTRFFEFHEGILTYSGHRYFIVEASLNYLLERELSGLGRGKQELFDLAFKYGKDLAAEQKGSDPCRFVTEFMSALGWGDVHAKQEGGKFLVRCMHFPWTKWSASSGFVLFRGMVSGMLSGLGRRKVVLRKFSQGSMAGAYRLECSE